MIRRLKTLLIAAALSCTGALAAEPPSTAPCVEPVADAASAPPPRLQSLRYRCLSLRGGQRVLVGEAGPAAAHTVLLVHGLGQNAHRDWATAIAPLVAGPFHVVALDLPGFGASPGGPQGYSFHALAGVLEQVLEQTAPGQRVHVVGHSLGAAVSLYFAHTRPALVDRLVLVDAAGILLKTVYVQHMASWRTPQVGIAPVDRVLKDLSDRIGGFRRGIFNNLDDRFDFSRWLAQNPGVRYALLGRHTQIEAGLGLVEHDFTAAIRETAAPTTVIWGHDDPIAPLRTGRLLAARMPDARLKVIDGAGHTPMQDSADAFRALLLEALVSPLSPRPQVEVPAVSQGDVVCRDQVNRRYSGRFDSLTLDNCPGTRVSGAQLQRLVMRTSSVTLDDTVIESDDVAITAENSEVTATNLRLSGRVCIRADNSRFDLAGASLRAREEGVKIGSPSRLFFSVSDWQGTDFKGDAHFLWPQDSLR
ncbi:MAG: alpha/beta hydrolase [Rhizobacter sp.]|nr:alpha/beta hydrolase [Rhizobacter sp.]